MEKERLEEILDELIGWALDHDQEFVESFIYAMGLNRDEMKELDLEEFYDNLDE